MGSHLGWEPATPHPLGGRIDVRMKALLRERYANGDETSLYGTELNERDLPWLEGVSDASDIDDANVLIAGIRQHGTIKLVLT